MKFGGLLVTLDFLGGKLKPPIITREKVNWAIPTEDCSGRRYTESEREDLIRYMIWAAEIQRDADVDYYEKSNKKHPSNT